jgi:hypothetical protein
MTNNLLSHYNNGSQIMPFLIYQISTGNLYICSTDTSDDTIVVTSNKIRDLTLDKSVHGKMPSVCLINIVFEKDSIVEVSLSDKMLLPKSEVTDCNDWLVHRTLPFIGQTDTSFIDCQLKNFQYCVEEIRKFKELKEPFFKKLLVSTIGYLESVRLVLGVEYGEDISAFDVASYNNYLERYDLGSWNNDSDKAISVSTTISSIGIRAYFEHYPVVFKFQLNPTTKVFNGVTLNSYEVV